MSNGNVFAVSAGQTAAIELEPGEKQQLVFNVQNISGRPLDGRAGVRVEVPTQRDWYTVQGRTERRFGEDEVHQFVVEIAIPEDAQADRYAFELECVGVDRPDESYGRSEKILVAVRRVGVDAGDPPVPRWVWLAAAGLLLVVGGVVVWPGGDGAEDFEAVEFTSISRGITFPWLPMEAIIREDEEWHRMWRETFQRWIETEDPNLDIDDIEPPEPPVDLAEEMILLTSRAARIMGFGPEVEEVRLFPEEIVVHYTVTVLGDDCTPPPHDAALMGNQESVSVPRSDLQVRFQAREVSHCAVRVPDVIGDRLREAAHKLEEHGLRWDERVRELPHDSIPSGRVTATIPNVDAMVAPGLEVGLFLSSGPR